MKDGGIYESVIHLILTKIGSPLLSNYTITHEKHILLEKILSRTNPDLFAIRLGSVFGPKYHQRLNLDTCKSIP